jgi:hypothetical protein
MCMVVTAGGYAGGRGPWEPHECASYAHKQIVLSFVQSFVLVILHPSFLPEDQASIHRLPAARKRHFPRYKARCCRLAAGAATAPMARKRQPRSSAHHCPSLAQRPALRVMTPHRGCGCRCSCRDLLMGPQAARPARSAPAPRRGRAACLKSPYCLRARLGSRRRRPRHTSPSAPPRRASRRRPRPRRGAARFPWPTRSVMIS